MAAGEGEAAGISGKRTYAGLTAGLGLTAAVPGTGASRKPAQKATFVAFAKLR
jgi:hypothetical protein